MVDSCIQLKKELMKVKCKITTWKETKVPALDAVLKEANDTLALLDQGETVSPDDIAKMFKQAHAAVDDCVASHKKYHADVSKVGKNIDKSFTVDFAATTNPEAFSGDKKKLLSLCIYDHFVRQGRVAISQEFSKEAELEGKSVSQQYLEIQCVVESLKAHNVEPALDWLAKQCLEGKAEAQLSSVSDFQFKLMRLFFLHIVDKDLNIALGYLAKFRVFSKSHSKELNELMGCLAYRDRLPKSPYAHLLSEAQWDDARTMFLETAFTVLNLPMHSPLATCMYAGCRALPSILDMHASMEKNVATAGMVPADSSELHADVDLGDRCLYHSIFACPILRRDVDVAMRLRCGHIISQEAEVSLEQRKRVKCPYCPHEGAVGDSARVYF